jgi:hypothetical protein
MGMVLSVEVETTEKRTQDGLLAARLQSYDPASRGRMTWLLLIPGILALAGVSLYFRRPPQPPDDEDEDQAWKSW